MTTPDDIASGSSTNTGASSSRSSQPGGAAKKRRTQEPSKKTPASNPMELNGTATGQAGTNAGESGGGGISGASDGPGPYIVPQPQLYSKKVIRNWHKTHKFLTFGFASKIIAKPHETPAPPHTMYYMTSPLAEVPVQKPFLYLSPQEFNLLRPGETVKSVKVKVYQRNVRVAFETASTTSGLATLNQNKNGMVAVGLNKTGYGVNASVLTVDDNIPMIITDIENPDYTIYTPMFYGAPNADGSFATTVPTVPNGDFALLKNYWVTATNNLTTGGWPNYRAKVAEYDAADAVGQCLMTYEYSPKQGMLVRDPAWRDVGAPRHNVPIEIVHGTGNNQGLQVTITDATANATIGETNVNRIPPTPAAATFYDLDIEKSQWLAPGVAGEFDPKIQPSLHIGVQAVPAITSGDVTSSVWTGIDDFTDVQAYFDVECEMITEYHEHVDRMFSSTATANTIDIPFALRRKQLCPAAQIPDGEVSVFAGLHPSGALEL